MAYAGHRVLAVLVVSFAGGCGGSERSAESAATDDSARAAESKGADEGAEGSEASEGESEGAAAARQPACDDGTCTPCGSALCPNGWYCDESAKGGPACGWLPECAREASCACVKRAFSGCSCEEQGGAAHVRCG